MGILLRLQKSSFRRFRDGHAGPWGALAVGLFGVRTLRRWSRRSEDVVYREKLEPGERLTITHRVDTKGSIERSERSRKSRRRPRASDQA